MGGSRVFVTRGSLTNFARDVSLPPPDRTYGVKKSWWDALSGLETATHRNRDEDFEAEQNLRCSVLLPRRAERDGLLPTKPAHHVSLPAMPLFAPKAAVPG